MRSEFGPAHRTGNPSSSHPKQSFRTSCLNHSRGLCDRMLLRGKDSSLKRLKSLTNLGQKSTNPEEAANVPSLRGCSVFCLLFSDFCLLLLLRVRLHQRPADAHIAEVWCGGLVDLVVADIEPEFVPHPAEEVAVVDSIHTLLLALRDGSANHAKQLGFLVAIRVARGVDWQEPFDNVSRPFGDLSHPGPLLQVVVGINRDTHPGKIANHGLDVVRAVAVDVEDTDERDMVRNALAPSGVVEQVADSDTITNRVKFRAGLDTGQ